MTKRDDDKAETSRMGDDDNEVVEIDDNDEVNAMNVKVNPSGHKPRIDGHRLVQQDHTGTWKRDVRRNEVGIPRRPRCPSWSYSPGLYTYMRQL